MSKYEQLKLFGDGALAERGSEGGLFPHGGKLPAGGSISGQAHLEGHFRAAERGLGPMHIVHNRCLAGSE